MNRISVFKKIRSILMEMDQSIEIYVQHVINQIEEDHQENDTRC